jgi:hypothetical protein
MVRSASLFRHSLQLSLQPITPIMFAYFEQW